MTSYDRFNKVMQGVDNHTVVKVCGLRSVEAAKCALDAGADCLGIICVPNRKRTVDPQVAKDISALVHGSPEYSGRCLVGVFRNQSKESVREMAMEYGLDVVQLHGDEDWREYKAYIDQPLIKRVVFPRDTETVQQLCAMPGTPCVPLFDSEAGGTGEVLDWTAIADWASTQNGVHYILAGGLTPENVGQAVAMPGVIGVDVSGGVETEGAKDMDKIRKFVANARGA